MKQTLKNTMKQMYAKQIKFRLATMKQMVCNAMNIIQITKFLESCTKKLETTKLKLISWDSTDE